MGKIKVCDTIMKNQEKEKILTTNKSFT